jgi:XRE family aerobic/anaerobic benzoate catabolism transcriptional regulator
MSTLDLVAVGQRVRARREALELTQRELAARAHLSVRFLAQVEGGTGNVSLLRFAELAHALGTTAAALLHEVDQPPSGRHVALVGVRGAGKSTIGARLARKLGVPLVELDAEIERIAQLRLAQIFELHGEAYYRRLERETLRHVLAERPAAVIATGGSVVTDRETWRLLRERTHTVWLRARPEDHWSRVVAQGDRRPMKDSPHAFTELKALLAARAPLYATAAATVDTSSLDVDQATQRVVATLP